MQHFRPFVLLRFMNRLPFSTFLVLTLFLFSCSPGYLAFKKNYPFRSTDGRPDYAQLDYWAAHPWKHDPSDSVPAPLRGEWKDSVADVFFLHPTTYTEELKEQNAAIDDEMLNAKTDFTTILYQASVFNKECRIFAPRYRQAHIKTFFMPDSVKAAEAFNLAYSDLKNAFDYYLQHWNNNRPIIIAGHSQGSLLAERLLKEYFDGKPLQRKLIVAYIVGWPVAPGYFRELKMCEDSLQTGCLCSWRTFRKNYIPSWLNEDSKAAYVTNPLSWTTRADFVSRSFNKGSILKNFNKIYKHTTDAGISNGVVYTRKPVFPWSFLYMTKNYHVGDINLYYINLRENISRRIAMYWKQ